MQIQLYQLYLDGRSRSSCFRASKGVMRLFRLISELKLATSYEVQRTKPSEMALNTHLTDRCRKRCSFQGIYESNLNLDSTKCLRPPKDISMQRSALELNYARGGKGNCCEKASTDKNAYQAKSKLQIDRNIPHVMCNSFNGLARIDELRQ